MKVTEIGTKVKQKIRLVADHLKSNLTCPKYKFVKYSKTINRGLI